jgi:anti-anti-sigma factor
MTLVQISQAQGRIPVTVFHLQDRVNLGNATELEQAAKDAHENGVRDLVLDMRNAPSVTSAGIRAIATVYRLLVSEDAKHIKLAAVSPHLREVLDIAGISQYIEMFETVEDAVASF